MQGRTRVTCRAKLGLHAGHTYIIHDLTLQAYFAEHVLTNDVLPTKCALHTFASSCSFWLCLRPVLVICLCLLLMCRRRCYAASNFEQHLPCIQTLQLAAPHSRPQRGKFRNIGQKTLVEHTIQTLANFATCYPVLPICAHMAMYTLHKHTSCHRAVLSPIHLHVAGHLCNGRFALFIVS